MTRRQPLLRASFPHIWPRIWMMSDERMGDGFLPALAQMPKGSGLVFRHYTLAKNERRALFERARKIARKRRIMVVLAGSVQEACAWRADGAHGRSGQTADMLKTAPVHNLRELISAKRVRADLIFLSPVFPTRSHPNARTLGRRGFMALALQSKVPVIALGGMNAWRARTLRGAYGWAGIAAFMAAG